MQLPDECRHSVTEMGCGQINVSLPVMQARIAAPPHKLERRHDPSDYVNQQPPQPHPTFLLLDTHAPPEQTWKYR